MAQKLTKKKAGKNYLRKQLADIRKEMDKPRLTASVIKKLVPPLPRALEILI